MRQSKIHHHKDIGWANGDPSLFPRLRACHEAGHKTGEENLDPSMHGLDRLYFCETCDYQFHVDSSD